MAHSSAHQLKGTPYLVNSDQGSELLFLEIQSKSADIKEQATKAQRKIAAVATEILEPFQRNMRTELVSESNRIEGYDWSPVAIDNALETHRELLSGSTHQLLSALEHDKEVMEAIGLYRAHELAEQWASSNERPREAEIRSLHQLVSAGELFAGRYKTKLNKIAGSQHRPVEPHDVQRSMRQLIRWWRRSKGDPILDATIVHAWLTHVHPFEDGNGRMARLLANLSLTQSGYPPLLIRADSDRGQYCDALARSDDGDIVPLYDLFTLIIRRTASLMSKPEYVRDVIEKRLLKDLESTHTTWLVAMQRFYAELSAELASYGLNTSLENYRDISAFSLLLEHNTGGNGWFFRMFDSDPRHPLWLAWFGYNTADMSGHLGAGRTYPSIFFSYRDAGYTYTRRFANSHGNGNVPDEVVVRPIDFRPVVIRRHQKTEELSFSEAARTIGAAIAAAWDIASP